MICGTSAPKVKVYNTLISSDRLSRRFHKEHYATPRYLRRSHMRGRFFMSLTHAPKVLDFINTPPGAWNVFWGYVTMLRSAHIPIRPLDRENCSPPVRKSAIIGKTGPQGGSERARALADCAGEIQTLIILLDEHDRRI